MKLIHLDEAAIGALLAAPVDAAPAAAAPCALSLGSFDGLHLGHRSLLATVLAARARLGLPASALFTFRHHPRDLIDPQHAPSLLTPWGEKLALLAETGIDLLVAADFCPALAATPYDEFVRRFLVGRLGMRHFVVGHDVHLGAGRGGNAETLAALAPRLGYGFEEVPALARDGLVVSSSQIRAQLAAGDVTGAAALLGRSYALWGEVVTGEERGRTIGFPTANLVPLEPQKLLPAPGVYAVRVLVPEDAPGGGPAWTAARRVAERLPDPLVADELSAAAPRRFRALPAMLNHGVVPTFHAGGLPRPRIEAHLLGFHGDLIGQQVKVEWVARLRDEHKFSGIRELKAQLQVDAEAARAALGG